MSKLTPTLLSVLTLLLTEVPCAQEVTLAPRSYAGTETALDFDPGSNSATIYRDGQIWIPTDQGEILRRDRAGKVHSTALPTTERVQGIWPDGASATVLVNDSFLSITPLGEVKPLRAVDTDAYKKTVPVEGGYVGQSAGPRLTYVRDDGATIPLSFLPTQTLEAVTPDGDGGDAATVAADEQQRTSAEAATTVQRKPATPRAANSAVPDGGFLAALDAEHVAYVTYDPYQLYILGLDGTTRVFHVDDSHVIQPDKSAAIVAHPEREFRGWAVEPGDKSIRAVFSNEGRVIVARKTVADFVLTRELWGAPKGFAFIDSILFIDVIDAQTGALVERIDRKAIKTLGGFVGMRGSDLVFLRTGDKPSLTFATAD